MKTISLLTLLSFASMFGFTQIDIRGKVRDKANQRVETKVDQAIDGAFDKTEQGAKNATKKNEKKEKQSTENKSTSQNEIEEKKPSSNSTPQNQDHQPSFKTYSNYDFVAGNRVLFYDDFSNGNIGDFPVMWNTNASGEIVTIENSTERWFMMGNDGFFYLNKGMNVPENFTIEMDIIVKRNDFQPCQVFMTLFAPEKNDLYPGMYVPGKSGIELNLGYYDKENDFQADHDYRVYNNSTESAGIIGRYTKPEGLFKIDKVSKLCIWVQKTRLRLYIDNVKVFDIQRAFSDGVKVGQIRFGTQDVCKIYITNFRVADATEDTRSKFMTEGKLISYGIYFDSGKDVVKPQSFGALKEMATILTENPTVKVLIVGHTDSDGDDKMNLDLSKRRAENVKKILVSEFKIDANRISTDGKGETEFIADNKTSENKAKNRRVEFIKQ